MRNRRGLEGAIDSLGMSLGCALLLFATVAVVGEYGGGPAVASDVRDGADKHRDGDRDEMSPAQLRRLH